jgi:hypothetical protein
MQLIAPPPNRGARRLLRRLYRRIEAHVVVAIEFRSIEREHSKPRHWAQTFVIILVSLAPLWPPLRAFIASRGFGACSGQQSVVAPFDDRSKAGAVGSGHEMGTHCRRACRSPGAARRWS